MKKLIVFNFKHKVKIYDDLKLAFNEFKFYRELYRYENLRTIKKMDYEKFRKTLLTQDKYESIFIQTDRPADRIRIKLQEIENV